MLLACKDALEYEEDVIPHDPLEGDNQYAQDKRYANTLEQYATRFPAGPVLKDLWPEKFQEGDESSQVAPGKRARQSEDPSHFLQLIRSPPSATTTAEPFINVRVKNSDGTEQYYKMGRTTHMRTLFLAHTGNLHVRMDTARFWLDGRILGWEDTIDTLRMEDGDQIDCIPRLVGC